MVDFELNQDFSVQMAQLETTDPVHADTFNTLYKQLINNDNKLNQNKIETSEKGSFNGIATLDPTGNVPLTQLGNVPTEPIGTIKMFSGHISSIPEKWHICDGTNGTPDLRDKFVVGAGSSYAKDATGGEAEHTLTVAEMPSHNHSVTYNEHGTNSDEAYYETSDLGDSGLSINTSSQGGNIPHNNLPPYYALYYIMKVSV